MEQHASTDQLFALYDGELTGIARREVEAHLEHCVECQHAYQQWNRTAKILFRVSKPELSERFVQGVLGRLRAAEHPRRVASWNVRLRWLVPALGGLACLLLVVARTERAVSLEALLVPDGRGHSSTQLVLASETPSTEEVLRLVMEGAE